MILDLLSSGIAADLLERTASTPRVRQAVELSLAPAFLLVGIGSIMNVMMSRLIWVAGRIERLADAPLPDKATPGLAEQRARELAWLDKRRVLARLAIKFSTGAAATISVVIALLFVSTYVDAPIGTIVACLWVLTVGLLITGLIYLLRETLHAADGQVSGAEVAAPDAAKSPNSQDEK